MECSRYLIKKRVRWGSPRADGRKVCWRRVRTRVPGYIRDRSITGVRTNLNSRIHTWGVTPGDSPSISVSTRTYSLVSTYTCTELRLRWVNTCNTCIYSCNVCIYILFMICYRWEKTTCICFDLSCLEFILRCFFSNYCFRCFWSLTSLSQPDS